MKRWEELDHSVRRDIEELGGVLLGMLGFGGILALLLWLTR